MNSYGHLIRTSGIPKSRFLFPRLIVVPLSSQEVDGVRKEKERLTAGSVKMSCAVWLTSVVAGDIFTG